MVLETELAKETVKALGMKHVRWLDNQTMNYVVFRYWESHDLDERMGYADYIRARMNLPKPLDFLDIDDITKRYLPKRWMK